MPSLDDVLAAIRAWQQPMDGSSPFRLVCRAEPGATDEEIEAAVAGSASRDELTALWSVSREAWLCHDTEYGQWGLHLLNPRSSPARTAAERARRPHDVRPDDVVLGEFLGDSDLLIHAPSEEHARRYLIALPLDPRADWPAAGASAAEVLRRFLDSGGAKF